MYFDPDRKVRRVEENLARGRAQTLLGPVGPPEQVRFAAGRRAHGSTSPGGVYSVFTWDQALVELVRDPQRLPFRLRAEVRHDKGEVGSEAGLYVCRRAYDAPGGHAHLCVTLAFNDTQDYREVVKFANERAGINQQLPRGNPVMLMPHLYADGLEQTWRPRVETHGAVQAFTPDLGKGRWRSLAVEVTATVVHGIFENTEVGSLTEGDLLAAIQGFVTATPLLEPDPFRACIDPVQFVPRGGVGLYVRNGTVAFRNVVLEPLSDR
jgi:serine/threonine-protein kinase